MLLLLYQLKLSVSVALIYLFYQLFLRRLTFYYWNRWFLLIYSILCFLFPFININSVLEQISLNNLMVVQSMSVVQKYAPMQQVLPVQPSHVASSLSSVHWAVIVVVVGMVLMLLRLFWQYASLQKLKRQALVVQNNGVKLYQVQYSIMPFSFGNAIFINPALHSDDELKEVIRHEFVHVKQQHYIDVWVTELLCLLNWYNPFVWLLRRAVRQNLEFIADYYVLQGGINKKQYQYLLLKVIGNTHYSVASQFNFSSLKKRIAMMNKLKSAKAHLLKFLLVLPLLAVLLLAFRNGSIKQQRPKAGVGVQVSMQENVVLIAGLVVDEETMQPLANVEIECVGKKIIASTDRRGYYEIKIPFENKLLSFVLQASKEGYAIVRQSESWGNFYKGSNRERYGYSVMLFALKKGSIGGAGILTGSVSEKKMLTYEYVLAQLPLLKETGKKEAIEMMVPDPPAALQTNVIRVEISDAPLAVETDITAAPIPPAAPAIPVLPTELPVLPKDVADISITENKINQNNNYSHQHKATVTLKNGKKEYYDFTDPTQRTIFNNKYNDEPLAAVAEVPAPAVVSAIAPVAAISSPAPDGQWLAGVNKIIINHSKITIQLMDGKKELYDLNKPAEKKAFDQKYPGKLVVPPSPVLPPARASRSISSNNSVINEKGYSISIVDNNGERVVLIKNKSNQMIQSLLLSEWNANQKQYRSRFGSMPPVLPVKEKQPVFSQFWEIPAKPGC